jgi:hypothetical protein
MRYLNSHCSSGVGGDAKITTQIKSQLNARYLNSHLFQVELVGMPGNHNKIKSQQMHDILILTSSGVGGNAKITTQITIS